MSLKNKTLLVYSNDTETLDRLKESLGPIHDHTIYSDDIKDATFRVENQTFDAIIYGAVEELSDPLGLFKWTRHRHEYKKVPWIIIDHNSSAPKILKSIAPHLASVVVPETWTIQEFYSALDTIFPPTTPSKNTIHSKVVNPIIAACLSSLIEGSGQKLDGETPYILEDGTPSKFGGDFSICLQFQSNEIKASVILSLQKALALTTHQPQQMGASDGDSNTGSSHSDKDILATLKSLGARTFTSIQKSLSKMDMDLQLQSLEIKERLATENRHKIYGLNLCWPLKCEKGLASIECVVAQKPQT